LPGGRLNQPESPEEALIREISEELPGARNIEIQNLLLAKRGFHREDQKDMVILYFRINATIDKVQLSSEHTDFIWVDREKLAELQQEPAEDFFDSMLDALDLALG